MPRATSPRTSSPPASRTRCTIQLAYAIGVSASRCRSTSTPTAPAPSATTELEEAIGRIAKLGKLTPRGIRTHLGLNKPIYRATAAYGHFGREADGDLFPWERLDLVEDLREALSEAA